MKNGTIQHYYKLIILFILLSTVPVIITGSLSYWKSAQAIQEYSTQEKVQNVYQIQTNVEQVLKNIDQSVTYFVRTSQTQQFIREEMSAEVFYNYQTIKSDLNHLQTLDTGIEDIVLVSFENDWLINNNGLSFISKEENDAMYIKYMSITDNSSWLLEEFDSIVVKNNVQNSCSHYISLVKRLPLLHSKKTGMVVVYIPSCSLTNIMAEKIDSESFLIVDDSNKVIAHSNPGYIGENFEIPETIISKINTSPVDGQFNNEIDGTDYKVTYRTSDYNDWTYLSFVKISDLNSKLSSIRWLTIAICSILLCLTLIFSIIGSRNIYKPIRHIQELIRNSTPDKSDMQKTKHDEFELIESHINQLLSKNNDLEVKMQRQVNQLKQLFIIRLLQGKVGKHEVPIKLTSFNYKQSWQQLSVFALQIDTFENSSFNKSDTDLLLFAINNVLEDLIDSERRLTPVVINQTQATVLVTDFENENEHTFFINQQAALVQNEIKNIFHLSISIGISRPFTDLLQAKLAFNESQEALKYRLKHGKESIIFYDNLNRNYQFFIDYPSNIKYKLFDAIKLADKTKANTELDNFFEYISNGDLHHNYYNVILTRFLYDLMELKQLLGIEIVELDNRPFLMEIYDLKTLQTIQDWFKEQLVHPLIEKVDKRTKNDNKSLSDKIIHIIQDSYDKDISLDSIAAQLHYNPNYLSNIFLKETKRSFSEYLLMYRLNKAKEWLVETDLSVKEIAANLQYNNSQNFIRSFRKIEGITPGKYRTDHKHK
ncbi:helix-turn-helix domain-containing protein [Paraliobacillus sediminis]|uniref:helix-turn-helix domain-containing protein n=1 Tax=Paraliobacillus sediminis TaxID=1885916 RepID=UPI000E3E2B18|nr:helix-turn-helix domain-containing protein [Paraliobacillus sediminis]